MGGKGKGKGKGKGCNAWHPEPRPCAHEGCTYAATWHPTHCCGACAHGNGHGGCCEKKAFEPLRVPEEQETSETVSTSASSDSESIFKLAEQFHMVDASNDTA